MPMQTYIIEMKADVGDEAHAALKQITRAFAIDLMNSAALVSGRTQPRVVARVNDAFYSTEELDIADGL